MIKEKVTKNKKKIIEEKGENIKEKKMIYTP